MEHIFVLLKNVLIQTNNIYFYQTRDIRYTFTMYQLQNYNIYLMLKRL